MKRVTSSTSTLPLLGASTEKATAASQPFANVLDRAIAHTAPDHALAVSTRPLPHAKNDPVHDVSIKGGVGPPSPAVIQVEHSPVGPAQQLGVEQRISQFELNHVSKGEPVSKFEPNHVGEVEPNHASKGAPASKFEPPPPGRVEHASKFDPKHPSGVEHLSEFELNHINKGEPVSNAELNPASPASTSTQGQERIQASPAQVEVDFIEHERAQRVAPPLMSPPGLTATPMANRRMATNSGKESHPTAFAEPRQNRVTEFEKAAAPRSQPERWPVTPPPRSVESRINESNEITEEGRPRSAEIHTGDRSKSNRATSARAPHDQHVHLRAQVPVATAPQTTNNFEPLANFSTPSIGHFSDAASALEVARAGSAQQINTTTLGAFARTAERSTPLETTTHFGEPVRTADATHTRSSAKADAAKHADEFAKVPVPLRHGESTNHFGEFDHGSNESATTDVTSFDGLASETEPAQSQHVETTNRFKTFIRPTHESAKLEATRHFEELASAAEPAQSAHVEATNQRKKPVRPAHESARFETPNHHQSFVVATTPVEHRAMPEREPATDSGLTHQLRAAPLQVEARGEVPSPSASRREVSRRIKTYDEAGGGRQIDRRSSPADSLLNAPAPTRAAIEPSGMTANATPTSFGPLAQHAVGEAVGARVTRATKRADDVRRLSAERDSEPQASGLLPTAAMPPAVRGASATPQPPLLEQNPHVKSKAQSFVSEPPSHDTAGHIDPPSTTSTHEPASRAPTFTSDQIQRATISLPAHLIGTSPAKQKAEAHASTGHSSNSALESLATRSKALQQTQRVSTSAVLPNGAPAQPTRATPEARFEKDGATEEKLKRKEEATLPLAAGAVPLTVAPRTLVAEPIAAPVLPKVFEPVMQQLLEDSTLRVAMSSSAARISLDTPDSGRVSLQVKVTDGVTDIRASGPAAGALEARTGDLRVALAHEGLALGHFDLTQHSFSGGHQQPERHERIDFQPPPTSKAAPTNHSSDDTLGRVAGRLHVKA